MSEFEREIRRQRWMAGQRMLAAMVAIQEARRSCSLDIEDGGDGNARVVRIGSYRWVIWTRDDGSEDVRFLERVTL